MNMGEVQTPFTPASAGPKKKYDGGIVAIGLFKLVEAVFFMIVGLAAIHFLHNDLTDAITRLVHRFGLHPEGRTVGWVLDHVDAITSHRLKQIGAVTFFYALLRTVEGVGLMLQQVWAEYLTVVVTTSFLPWEIYEVVERANWFRIWLLIVNLAVLAYLVWWLRRKRHMPGRASLSA